MENKGEFEIMLPKKGEVINSANVDVSPKIKTLDAELEKLAIELAGEGKTLKAIRDVLNIDSYHMALYLKNNQYFESQLTHARNEGLEALADSILDIAEQEPDVLRARVKSENIKWLLSKRKAHVYGDKIEVNMNATVDIASALTEAKARANAVSVASVVGLEDILS